MTDESADLSLLVAVTDGGHYPLEQFERTERHRILAEFIDRLPETERKVVSLYYLEKLNMKEVGIVLNVSESRVFQLRSQALVRLRANIA